MWISFENVQKLFSVKNIIKISDEPLQKIYTNIKSF